ncbi:MAG: hypothetical protein Q4G54_04835 [Pelistega sp.]|nr:hypothetical protein [Pelistega sp.]
MRKWMWILWPSFLAAGLLSGLVFAFIDPADVLFLSSYQLDTHLVYAIGFFVFWLTAALSSMLTLALSVQSDNSLFGDEDDF